MGIVLNEYEWAESMIRSKTLGSKPTETLSRIAKYYIYNKYNKTQVRDLLDRYMIQCDPDVSLVKWSDTLDKIVRNCTKYPIIMIDGVTVYKEELNKIKTLDGIQMQRLAFTLLCVSKYWDAVSEKNNHWVNSQDKEIMQMANMKPTLKRQSLMLSTLRDAGFIKFSKKVDNLNIQVLFVRDSGDEQMFVSDFRNVGYQYMMYCGKQFIECDNCGVVCKKTSNRQKCCPECAKKIHYSKKLVSSPYFGIQIKS